MEMRIGSEINDSTELMTKDDAVSTSSLSNLEASIAATAEPGKETSRMTIVMSVEESPINNANMYVNNGKAITFNSEMLMAFRLNLIRLMPTVTPIANRAAPDVMLPI